MKYITSQEMQEIDKLAIEEFGIPAIILMENAGQKASRVALDMLSPSQKEKVICICGKGNNGGDGFVCCRHLINNGAGNTDIFLVCNPLELKGNAKINYKILEKMGRTIKILKNKKDFQTFETELKKAQLVIDAMLGIGLSGKVRQPYKNIINLINQSQKPVLSLDVPSGLDATKGNVPGVCIKATKTVTFALPKTGFIKNDGPLNIGELITVDISIPKTLLT